MGLFSAMERLKVRIHSARIPLSKNGQRFMGVVYFTVPIIFGYYSMGWVSKAETKNRVSRRTAHAHPDRHAHIHVSMHRRDEVDGMKGEAHSASMPCRLSPCLLRIGRANWHHRRHRR